MPRHDGTHILLDLHGCKFDDVPDESALRDFMALLAAAVGRHGLEMLGEYSHFFQPNGFTAAIVLAESHIAVHTWPEQEYVSADIFVCNYSKDNTKAAEALADEMISIFKAERVKRQQIKRGD